MSASPFPITAGTVASSAASLPSVDFRSSHHGAHGKHGAAAGISGPQSVTDLLASALGDGPGALPAGAGAALLTAGVTQAGAAGAPVAAAGGARRGSLIDTQA